MKYSKTIIFSLFILNTFAQFAVVTNNYFKDGNCVGAVVYATLQKAPGTCASIGFQLGALPCIDISSPSKSGSVGASCFEFTAVDLFVDLVTKGYPSVAYASSLNSPQPICQFREATITESFAFNECIFTGPGFSSQVSSCGPNKEIIKNTYSDENCITLSRTEILPECKQIDPSNPSSGQQKNICSKPINAVTTEASTTTKSNSSSTLKTNSLMFIVFIFIVLNSYHLL